MPAAKPTKPSSAARLSTRSALVTLTACVSLLALCGCASNKTTSASTTQEQAPAYASEPFTHQQVLVEKGGQLAISDGCASCHLTGAKHPPAPSFAALVGHRVQLADGRHVLVDEREVREALLHPESIRLKGLSAAPMIASVEHLKLAAHPAELAALVAFIEQIGPE